MKRTSSMQQNVSPRESCGKTLEVSTAACVPSRPPYATVAGRRYPPPGLGSSKSSVSSDSVHHFDVGVRESVV